MNAVIISYSLTGNNDALASGIAQDLQAKHVRITEDKPRKTSRIVMDVIFNRVPRTRPMAEEIANADLVVFVGPVWMGKVASPFRACFDEVKGKLGDYAYVSISGGTLGPNPKLADELLMRTGKKPVAVIDLHIVDLLPSEPKPTLKATSSYRLNKVDLQRLTDAVREELQKSAA